MRQLAVNASLSFLLLTGTLFGAGIPDLAFHSLDGSSRKLSSLRGEVVVLTFWATWCGPCQEELPRLSALAPHYTGKPVRFVAISIDEARDRAKVDAFLVRHIIGPAENFAVWTGGNTDQLTRLGLGEIVPGTLVLDPDGKAITRISGEAQDADVQTAVDWLLNNRQGPTPVAKLKRY